MNRASHLLAFAALATVLTLASGSALQPLAAQAQRDLPAPLPPAHPGVPGLNSDFLDDLSAEDFTGAIAAEAADRAAGDAALQAALDQLRADNDALAARLAAVEPGPWRMLSLMPNYRAGPGGSPAFRVVGDMIEFRGQVARSNGDLVSGEQFATLPASRFGTLSYFLQPANFGQGSVAVEVGFREQLWTYHPQGIVSNVFSLDGIQARHDGVFG